MPILLDENRLRLLTSKAKQAAHDGAKLRVSPDVMFALIEAVRCIPPMMDFEPNGPCSPPCEDARRCAYCAARTLGLKATDDDDEIEDG